MMRALLCSVAMLLAVSPAFAQDHADHDFMDHGETHQKTMDHDAMGHGPVTSTDPHAGHDMSGIDNPPMEISDAELAAAIPEGAPWGMAGAIWGDGVMAAARDKVLKGHGDMKTGMVMADRLEVQFGDGGDVGVWDVQGWYGGDRDKLFIKTEGEFSFSDDEIEDGEVQALWSRAVSTYWDVQTGVRYDFEPRGRTHAVLGVQGLAPYLFEVDAAAFLSTDGDLTARIEAEYEILLTQSLVLQPRVEVELSAQDIEAFETGAGVSGFDAGLRLSYAVVPEFAPYVGVEWQTAFGDTRDIIREEGGDPERIVALIGLRTWF